MQELLHAAGSPPNIVYTILLMIVILYWISVVIGVMDLGAFDMDVDMDADVDMDLDVDVDADADLEVEGSAFSIAGALHFFNFGKVPFMFLMTFLVTSMWIISIWANQTLPGGGTLVFALVLLFPNLVAGLLITKVLSMPLIPVFKDYSSKGVAPIDYIGQVCTMRFPTGNGQVGQAEVLYDGNPLLISIKTDSESGAFKKGQKALIIGRTEDKKFFLVRALAEHE